MLEEVGFDVDVATVPAEGPEREEFAPALERYNIVLSNFTDFGGPPAPRHLFDKLTRWVAQGGGFVAVHAATAGMEHLPEYVRMVASDGERPGAATALRSISPARSSALREAKAEVPAMVLWGRRSM
jgi:hypothetical protein